MPHYTALTPAAATGTTDPTKMGYTTPTVLSNGVTNVMMDYPGKEVQQVQTDAVYCHEVFDGHTTSENQESTSDSSRQGSSGPFDRPNKTFKAPWDSEMTHFFINEYRNVSGMVTKKRDAFLHISEKMTQKGYDVTPYTVEKKWHNLIKAYKNVLYRAIRKGEEKISWEYFEEMDDIIKNSTPSLPAPGNLKRLALSRKVSPNPVASPASGPETISVTPDFLPSPPSPDGGVNKSHPTPSPSVAEVTTSASYPTSLPPGPSSTRSPSAYVASSPISYVVHQPHTTITSHQDHGSSHMLADTTAGQQLHHSSYYQHQILPPASIPAPTYHPHTPTILNTPTISTQYNTTTPVEPQSTTAIPLSSSYPPNSQNTTHHHYQDPMQHPPTRSQGTNVMAIKTERDRVATRSLTCAKRKKWRLKKARQFARRCHRPDLQLLFAQREMNTQLKTLNTHIVTMGHTLNENIVGLKRAVERMVSIMLQNKPGT